MTVMNATRTVVLLVNLGSPEAPSPRAVRAFLDEFLRDPLVVDTNPVVWWFVRKLFILPKRGRASAELYEKVWTEDGSPLIVISKKQASELARVVGDETRIELAMRYGNPSIASVLRRLADEDVERVRLLPLFPQWSKSTSGTIEREARDVLARIKSGAPELDIAPAFFDHAGYIDALARLVTEHRADATHLVFSFHGVPERFIDEGDPYQAHCETTARLLVESLGLADGEWSLTYQSRFGGEPWLGPDVAQVVPALAGEHPRLAVVCPGFAADCLETIEEIGLRLTEDFTQAGGEALIRIPCLDTHPVWIDALAEMCS